MAEEPTTTRYAILETAFQKLTALNQQLENCRTEDRDALERAIADQEEDVLDTPAGSLGQLRAKLELVWANQLFGLDPETEHRRLILEDLEALTAELGELVRERA